MIKTDFEKNVFPWLQLEGKTIGRMAQDGNPKAQEVVKLYTMLLRDFNELNLILLKQSIADLRAFNASA